MEVGEDSGGEDHKHQNYAQVKVVLGLLEGVAHEAEGGAAPEEQGEEAGQLPEELDPLGGDGGGGEDVGAVLGSG